MWRYVLRFLVPFSVLFSLIASTACGVATPRAVPTGTSTEAIGDAGVVSSEDTSGQATPNKELGDRRLPTPPPLPTAVTIPTFPPARVPAVGSEASRRLASEIEPLGVNIESPELAPGDRYWRAVAIQWHDPEEAAYRHYVWVRTRDKNGNLTAGHPAIFKWPSGQSSGPTPVDFPMYAAGHSYTVWIDGGIPSEKVTGMGLGTPSSRYTTDHVEYFVTFQIAVRGE